MAATPPFGAILAGGKSRRFGSPKALATLGDETILARVLRAHVAAGLSTFIVADEAGKFAEHGVPVLVDLVPGAGPLGGLHAALSRVVEAGGDGVCVTGCDTPFLEPGMLRALLENSPGHDAVVVVDDRTANRHPHIAWYSTTAMPIVEEAILNRDLALHRFVDRLPNALLLSASRLPLRRPSATALLNVNTRADLEIALEHLDRYPDT